MKVDQKKRNSSLINATKKDWKKINIDIDFNIGRKLTASFAREYIFNLTKAYVDKHLKYFAKDNTKWMLLNHVMYFSAKGDPYYKNKKVRSLDISSKKIEQIIDECIDAGLFIYADPINGIADKKIKSVRPSIELLSAWSKYNIKRMQQTLKNIKRFDLK